MALLSGISEANILEVKKTEIHEKASQSIKSKGWLPNLFRSIVNKAKDFLQNLIREHDMPPKPVLEIDMAEFRTMQSWADMIIDNFLSFFPCVCGGINVTDFHQFRKHTHIAVCKLHNQAPIFFYNLLAFSYCKLK